MNKTNKLLISGVVTAAVMGIIPFASAASGQNGSGSSDIVSKIATKFNLNKADVQSVFDEDKAANQATRQAEMQSKLEERLTQAVTDKKITEAQKTLILEHEKTVQTKMEEIRNMSDDTARKTAMDALRTESQKWATDNNIDSSLIGPGGMGRGDGPEGKGMGHGEDKGGMERGQGADTQS